MLISLNELKKLVDIKIPDDELFKLIGSRLVEIEGVEDLAPKYKKIYIVKVLEASPIEGTHLHLCKIDAGENLNSEVDPDHDGFIQVVCGAPNVRAGMLTAWIAPGAVAPASIDEGEPFEISARKLRGFMSYGMLAAADELALGSDHDGIVEIDPEMGFHPGIPFAEAFELNDKIIEVENKSLTHRPDCFGLYGFAREVAGILGEKFAYSPENFLKNDPLKDHDTEAEGFLRLSVNIKDFSACPRYEAILFDFKNLPEKKFFDASNVFLSKAGMRSISPIVDATNEIMLMTGQPLHAFDYDKFVKVGDSEIPEIGVRLAREGEKLTLLDDKEIELNKNDIVICSNDTPVALAGAMGGKNTEIDENTKKIIVEVASFSLYNLRKTQMSHGIFSEAITRFTKGRPATDLLPGINASVGAFEKLGGKVVGVAHSPLPNDLTLVSPIPVSISEINSLLGTAYSKELIEKTLKNVDFEIKTEENSDVLKVVTPSWRSDIHIKEDIIEEVGRLLGFDNIPVTPPLRPFVCPETDSLFAFKSKVREVLSNRLGANEVLTYSFVSESLQEKVGENVEDSYKIINSISPELECFRQSIVPSLLEKIPVNEKAGYKDFTLYEINQVTKKSFGLTSENVPEMKTELGLVTFGDFYRVKYLLEELGKSLGLEFVLKPLETSDYFEPLHSAKIFLKTETEEIEVGALGEVKKSVLKRFKVSEVCSALKTTLGPCSEAKISKKFGIKLSRFPFVSRDLTVRVKTAETFASVKEKIEEVLRKTEDLIYIIEPVSIFRKEAEDFKNISFHLKLANSEKTFESKEVSDIMEEITKNLSALGAEVV